MSVRGVPVETRFWAKVAKSPDGCWEWQAFIMASGYGGFVHGREGASVHALSREFGVSRPTVKGILTRKAWRHVE